MNSRTTNFLAFLIVAQTALILVLLIKVINLENHPIEPAIIAENAASVEPPVAAESHSLPMQSTRPLNEGRLRKIVREELRAQLDESLPSATQAAEDEGPEPVSAAEYQYRLDAAMENLDYYIVEGEISNADMIKLQSEIALLDEDGRRQMLSLLTRAMSTGELEGHF